MGDLDPAMPGMAGMTGAGPSMAGMTGLMPVNGDSAPDETVAAYGPTITFTFTFPQPGHYRVWLQAERHYQILTMPADLTITPAP
jgi:hypothetical protein